MESLKYIFNKKQVHRGIIAILLFCCFYRIFYFNDEVSLYLAGVNIFFLFTVFPILYYYLINVHHKFTENQFISIRRKNKVKNKVIEQTLITLIYALVILIVSMLPCISVFIIDAWIYSLDIALLNFSIFLLFINLTEILSYFMKFYRAFSIMIFIEVALYFFIFYNNVINITPLLPFPNYRIIISIICILISLVCSFIRIGVKDV